MIKYFSWNTDINGEHEQNSHGNNIHYDVLLQSSYIIIIVFLR